MSAETTGKDTSVSYSNCKIFRTNRKYAIKLKENISLLCSIYKCHPQLSVAPEVGKM